ncbi:MAG TPA: HAD-IIB family hydrolase [Candidatus Paceibacterota bacterium]|nr:HAD-IIB family hydrolase [Candidatus Paceibacterota bacterium]
MNCPRAALFDLDDTLAESFQPPAPEMVDRLLAVLEHMPVAILTAAGMPRIERQFLDKMVTSRHIDRFYVLPNSAAQCFTYKSGTQECAYSLGLSETEREKITRAIQESIAQTNIVEGSHATPQIIPREAQVAVAFLGLDAGALEKATWDPTQSKRRAMKTLLEQKIPEFEILIGGYTTIDITRKGVDKAYGVRWLSTALNIPAEEMLYVGDAFYEGGNDVVVVATGVQTRVTSGPHETLMIIDELLRSCGGQ